MARPAGSGPSLAGIRVVERGSGIAAGYCGKILADLGAVVTRIALPGHADPHRDQRRSTRALLDSAKRVLQVRESSDEPRHEAEEALRAADIVIDDWSPEEHARVARE